MRKLARAVGVTAPALYRHFGSREEVLFAVFEEAFDGLFRALTRALSRATPLERFETAGDAYMDFALEHPRYFQMIHSFRQLMGLDETPPELHRRYCAIRQFWDDRVRECVDAGILKAQERARITLTLWGHAYGLLSLYSRRMMDDMPEEAFREEFRASRRRVLTGVGTDEVGSFFSAAKAPRPEREAHALEAYADLD